MSKAERDFTEFVAYRSSALLRTAYLLCGGDRGHAEDLLQETLERVYPRWRKIAAQRGLAFLFGPGDRFVLALADDGPLMVSPAWQLRADGTGTRQWSEMDRLDDFVQFSQLPAGTNPAAVVVGQAGIESETDSRKAHERALFTLPASRYQDGWDRQTKVVIDNRLPWPFDSVFRIDGAVLPVENDRDWIFDALQKERMQDPLNQVWLSGFQVVAELPDGRSVVATEVQPSVERSGFYALLVQNGEVVQVVYGGELDRNAALPAKVELPDGQGWIVAHYQASLRYRIGEKQDWVEAGMTAALLPAEAIQVEVTLPDANAQVVNLVAGQE